MERGDEYVENGENEEAIIEFRNVLQIDPNHAPAHEALSIAYLAVNKSREAYWEMSETVRLDPSNVEARLRYGTVSSAIGEQDIAREQAEAILEIEPGKAQAYMLRAQARLATEDFEGAEADLVKAIESRPNGAAYRYLYASFLEQRDRVEESIAELRELVELEESYMALSSLGRLVGGTEDGAEESEALLRRNIEVALEAPVEPVERDISDTENLESLVPNIVYEDAVSGAYLLLAAHLYAQDRFEESIEALEEGASKLDGHTGLIYQMARLYAARGMTEKADELIVRATQESPGDPGPQLILSAHLQSQGDLEGALEAAIAAVEIDDESRTALMREAELRVDLGYQNTDLEEIKHGRSIVETVLEGSPSDPEAHFVRAKIELAEGDAAAAEQSLQTALETRPDWPQARFVLGSTLAALGETGRARGELARAVELDPAMSEARKLLTKVHAQLGEHEFAIEQGRAYLRQVPTDIPMRIILGQSLIRVGRSQEAYDEVSKIREAKRDAAANFALGRLDVAFGRKELGKERLLKANEQKPGQATVLRVLLALDQEAGDLEASSKRIREATERSPSDTHLAQLAGEVALLEGDLTLARESLEWAVELDGTNVSAMLILADLERQEGKLDEMLAVIEQAAAANPESADLQYRLGLLYQQMGKQDQAVAAYERALVIDDDLAVAKNNLAYLLTEVPGGDLDRALELAQEAKEERPDDPNAADTLGWVLLKRGVPGAAIGYLEEALERFPDQSSELRGIVGNHLAEAYEKNKESTKAVATSKDVIKNFDKMASAAKKSGTEIEEPDWARDARTRIERLSSSG
jgi:tetratricopeptide (TPR) repeat protein